MGPHLASQLQKLGIHTVQDILFHLPLRYQDRTRVVPLANIRNGDHVVVEGGVSDVQLHYGRRPSLLCLLQDATGSVTLRFFHFTSAQREMLTRKGMRIRCFGEVRWANAGLMMVHPEYRYISADTTQPVEENLTPIYPTTEGIHQGNFRRLTDQALLLLDQCGLEEYLPPSILEQFALFDISAAIRFIHRPPPDAPKAELETGYHPAQQRLAFEELLAHQLSLHRIRFNLQQYNAPPLCKNNLLVEKFLSRLPFSLTSAQQRVLEEISQDLSVNRPMLRLVQGDVGSGKTVVAVLAILQSIASGYQAALMAPTELLAEQHFKNMTGWLEDLGIKIVFLTSHLKTSIRKQMVEMIASGEAHIVVGTHALFQKHIQFMKLGLVVIDEQHRFGVHQRLELWEKGRQGNVYPHQLIMTATPIPRTLAMTAYADLDYSIIDELPPGRKPVMTILISTQRRLQVIQRIYEACQSGRQAYWVCTLIEESDVLQCQAAEVTAALLTQSLPNVRVGLIHGRLKSQEKEHIMSKFRAGEIDLLVATTVIEVGVDVPNATLMVIENSERLGLAQLHQLRGRIGRGGGVSHCILMYQGPLSAHAKKRLWVMKHSNDGFEIAQQDLELRGPGEVLGTRQTGLMQMRIADLLRDKKLLPTVQKASHFMLEEYPHYVEPLIARWVVGGGKYGSV